jgi:hypothetical protein
MHKLQLIQKHGSSRATRKITMRRTYSAIASMPMLAAQQSHPGGHATAAAKASSMIARMVLAQRPHFGEQPRQE